MTPARALAEKIVEFINSPEFVDLHCEKELTDRLASLLQAEMCDRTRPCTHWMSRQEHLAELDKQEKWWLERLDLYVSEATKAESLRLDAERRAELEKIFDRGVKIGERNACTADVDEATKAERHSWEMAMPEIERRAKKEAYLDAAKMIDDLICNCDAESGHDSVCDCYFDCIAAKLREKAGE